MDGNLFARWQQAQAPFDDVVLYPEKWISLVQLSNALHIIVALLKPRYNETPLFTLLDWHEHDGWLKDPEATGWAYVKGYATSLTSPKPADAYLDDDLVYRIFYPLDNSFLLRIDMDDFGEIGGITEGRFDISGNYALLQPLHAELEKLLSVKIICEKAKPYFDKRYAG